MPGFTRSNVDGYAVRAADTFGAHEEQAVVLAINDENLATGVVPRLTVGDGTATPIATGGILPRGADAVVMVEDTVCTADGRQVEIRRALAPAAHLTQAASGAVRP